MVVIQYLSSFTTRRAKQGKCYYPCFTDEWLRDGKCLVQGHLDLKSSAAVLMTLSVSLARGQMWRPGWGPSSRQGAHGPGDITLLPSPSSRGGAECLRSCCFRTTASGRARALKFAVPHQAGTQIVVRTGNSCDGGNEVWFWKLSRAGGTE